jgi:hypothetical protein
MTARNTFQAQHESDRFSGLEQELQNEIIEGLPRSRRWTAEIEIATA